MFRHFTNCEAFNEFVQRHRLADINKRRWYVYLDGNIFNTVLQNYRMLNYNLNWWQCFVEAYHIKLNKPSMSDGLKA